jgi:hypothetical protein
MSLLVRRKGAVQVGDSGEWTFIPYRARKNARAGHGQRAVSGAPKRDDHGAATLSRSTKWGNGIEDICTVGDTYDRPPRRSVRALTIRQVRLVAGPVLFTYGTLHFANHALGNISIDAIESGLAIQRRFGSRRRERSPSTAQ